MSKLNSPLKLTRGTKLSEQHWEQPTFAVENLLASSSVDGQNLSLNVSPFTLTMVWPSLPAYFLDKYQQKDARLVQPFILPPPQDLWTNFQIGDSTPFSTLKSMCISFDSGMGPNGVRDVWDPDFAGTVPPASAQFVNGEADKYTFTLTIKEKEQAFNYGFTADRIYNVPQKIIYQQTFTGLLFNGEVQRFNPVYTGDIDIVVSPYKTYVMYVDFANLNDPLDNPGVVEFVQLQVSSLAVQMNFESRLLQNDNIFVEVVQNSPTNYTQSTLPVSLSIDVPTSGSIITATAGTAANGRIQTNAEDIDAELVNGLDSGRDLRGQLPPTSPTTVNSNYFIMAVPLFMGTNDIRGGDINTCGLPYGTGPLTNPGSDTIWDGFLFDRRLIPISQPMTIHNVTFLHSYYSPGTVVNYPYTDYAGAGPASRPSPNAPGELPVSTTFETAVGVGICTALRSDSKRYEQVAYGAWFPTTKTNYLIDRIKTGGTAPFFGLGTDANYDMELFQIPLNQNASGGAQTRSYYDQGYPYYVGRAGLGAKNRTDVGDITNPGTGITPRTLGAENFIEVRVRMSDVAGLNPGANVLVENETTYVGTNGLWVYITGKMETAYTSRM
jgi:hypothetical protein